MRRPEEPIKVHAMAPLTSSGRFQLGFRASTIS